MAKNPRTCVGCRRRDTPSNLVRVAVIDHALTLDRERNLPGRGAWIHPDLACLNRAIRNRAFGRALKEQELEAESVKRLELDPTWANRL